MQYNELAAPLRSQNRVRSGRASRRSENHRVANRPWFGPVQVVQLPCPKCAQAHKWNRGCAV